MSTIRFAIIKDPLSIFGMVGRCGGGYNTVWSDWSDEGVQKRNAIITEFELRMNEICGHYELLEQDILAHGFANPLVVTCGPPSIRKLNHIPPYIQQLPKTEWLLLEGTSGGSRLWVAQKHNLSVPCIVNDKMGRFQECEQIKTLEDAQRFFSTPPKMAIRGGELMTGQCSKSHLDDKWEDENVLDAARRPMWKEIMAKHGYTV